MIRNQFVDKQPTPSAGEQPILPDHPDINKRLDERWNQAKLGYFDSHLDKAIYKKREVIILGKDIYYRIVVLFVLRIQNLATFKEVPSRAISANLFEAWYWSGTHQS